MANDRKIIELAYSSKMKHNQMIPGDNFYSKSIKEKGRLIAVLADGLGSGVKAGVLSTLTATMALRLMEDKMDAVHTAELIIFTEQAPLAPLIENLHSDGAIRHFHGQRFDRQIVVFRGTQGYLP